LSRHKFKIHVGIFASLACTVLLATVAAAQSPAPPTDIRINRRPLTDFGAYTRDKIESKSINLDAPFLIELTGKLDKSGKLDPTAAKYTKAEGDRAIVDVVKKAIESINDAGFFAYLTQLDNRSSSEIVIRAAQDDTTFMASINLDSLTEARARTVASALNSMVTLAKSVKSRQDSASNDDILLLGSIAALSEGKSIVIKFNMPKATVREMIERKLAEPQTK
jgi:hypothetical protein